MAEETQVKKPTEDRKFYYPTKLDPMRQVPGTSRYLDDVQREEAEIARAKVEGREPNLKNPPAMQSTPLVDQALVNVPQGHKADVVLPVSRRK